jgi:hypothetical protein
VKYDLQVENFRRFFDARMMSMTYEHRQRLSPQILARLFKKDGSLHGKSFSFMEQLYILSQTGLGNIFILIEDPDNGMNVVDFEKNKKKMATRRLDISQSEEMLAHGSMVMAAKDLSDWMNHQNALSNSGVMNYALKLKGTKESKIVSKEEEFSYLCNLISNYEASKKKIVRKELLDIPDLYVLFYLADGQEKNGAHIYKQKYIDAVNSSKLQILRSFRKLDTLGYVQRFGKAKRTTYKITYLGKGALAHIMKTYIFA